MRPLPLAFVLLLCCHTAAADDEPRPLRLSIWPEGVRIGMTKADLLALHPKASTTGMAMDDEPEPRDNDVAFDRGDGVAFMFFLREAKLERVGIVSSPLSETAVGVLATTVRELGEPDHRLVLVKRADADDRGAAEESPLLAWDHPKLSIQLRIDGGIGRAALIVSSLDAPKVPGLEERAYDPAADAKLFQPVEEAIRQTLADRDAAAGEH